ncbi:MAG: IS21 family transposase [Bacteroidota bacterium]|nr:IS21 family transposase [Bacteroidota bacterium]
MLRVGMYYSVKTLKEKGYSLRKISKELGIHRKSVKEILRRISEGKYEAGPINKIKKLEIYRDDIEKYLENGLTAKAIHQRLVSRGVEISYPSVSRYVKLFAGKGEVYIPVNNLPGEEAQVDFGYFGLFEKDGKKVKVWCFSMILSNSRYAYYCFVADQRISTFLLCHIKAFEYFGGVSKTVKIDNLKSGVLKVDFYEPEFQHQYAQLLSHYGSSGITARPRRGQDKGKVESGIKYAKNNFLKGLEHRDYYQAEKEFKNWNDNICNKRLHGTTRKIPFNVFAQEEKPMLLPLPSHRFEILDIGHRNVNSLAHINYRYNYYSVPYQYAKEMVRIESNGSVLRIYKGTEQIALHQISTSEGNYITNESHKPPYKQKKDREYYLQNIQSIGDHAVLFMEALEKHHPYNWYRMVSGLIHLQKRYNNQVIDKACKRALNYQAYSYQTVKNICENRTYETDEKIPENKQTNGGYNHNLSIYDGLINKLQFIFTSIF